MKDAIKIPVIVSHRVVLARAKGSIIIDGPIKPGMIKIGFGGVRIFDRKYSRGVWYLTGKVIFKGKASLGYGTKLSVIGDLTLGDNFAISAQTQIICNKKITFGKDVLIGWDCLFMDSDAHKILDYDGNYINQNREIIVGDRVWFGARTTVVKGAKITNDIVVATNSCVSGKFETTNCVIGGNPPKVLKRDITWEV